MVLPKKPLSRVEQYLNKVATGTGELPVQPLSRTEQYLAYICENGGGSEHITDLGVIPQAVLSYPKEPPSGYGDHGFVVTYAESVLYVAFDNNIEESEHGISLSGGINGYVNVSSKAKFYYCGASGNWIKSGSTTFSNGGTITKTTIPVYYDNEIVIAPNATTGEITTSIVTEIQQARGISSSLYGYMGKAGQIVVNIDDNSIHVMDGVTLGGHKISPISSVSQVNITDLEERVLKLENIISHMQV